MHIMVNGHAGEMSKSCRLYRPSEGLMAIQITGNFAGASVLIEYSLDDKNWAPVTDFENVTEEKFGYAESINGWVRCTIKGGTPFTSVVKPINWRSNTYYEKDIIVFEGQTNRYLKCKENHLDAMIPDMNFWEETEVNIEEPDNSNATIVNVAIQ